MRTSSKSSRRSKGRGKKSGEPMLPFGRPPRRAKPKNAKAPTWPPKPRRSKREPHVKREAWRGMSHVIYKLKPGLDTLRKPKVLRVLEPVFRAAKERKGFRLICWSLQEDHVHLIVEGESTPEVSKGLQGLAIRITKALNRLWGRRGKGSVFRDRHRKVLLRDRRHIRNAIPYVLNNALRHGRIEVGEIDRYSSAPWWPRIFERVRRPLRRAPVADSRYMLGICNDIVPISLHIRPGYGPITYEIEEVDARFPRLDPFDLFPFRNGRPGTISAERPASRTEALPIA